MTGIGNSTALVLFVLFTSITLVITWLAARRAKSRASFYTGGGGFSAFKNGLAIAGDYMSAAAFLGVSAFIATAGFDGMLYGVGFRKTLPYCSGGYHCNPITNCFAQATQGFRDR